MNQDLREALRSGDEYDMLSAIAAAEDAGPAAATLVPDLAALLSSDKYVRDIRSGHASLCERAAFAIRCIGVAPDIQTLRTLLTSDRVIEFPVACFDQGMYVGDYASEEIAPAGLAASLVPLMGIAGLTLLPELAANARSKEDTIAEPASRAIDDLIAKVATEDANLAAQLRGEVAAAEEANAIDRIRALSERHSPKTT